jgi:hypothetical protein
MSDKRNFTFSLGPVPKNDQTGIKNILGDRFFHHQILAGDSVVDHLSSLQEACSASCWNLCFRSHHYRFLHCCLAAMFVLDPVVAVPTLRN